MLNHLELILVELNDLADLLAGHILQSVLLDVVVQRLLVLSDEEVSGHCSANCITQLVESNELRKSNDLCGLLCVSFIAILYMAA
jgi:hypothetical protein